MSSHPTYQQADPVWVIYSSNLKTDERPGRVLAVELDADGQLERVKVRFSVGHIQTQKWFKPEAVSRTRRLVTA